VGAEATFRGSQVLMVACGDLHSLVVKKDGALWTFCSGSHGQLGHHYHNTRLVPTCIREQHFNNAKIISAALGSGDRGRYPLHLAMGDYALELRHANGEATLMPTRIAPSLLTLK